MIVSRGFNSLRYCNLLKKSTSPRLCGIPVRSSGHYTYRGDVTYTEVDRKLAVFVGTITWGWIIYFALNHIDHVLGEFTSPDPTLWTDEELGIPPDEEGPYSQRNAQ